MMSGALFNYLLQADMIIMRQSMLLKKDFCRAYDTYNQQYTITNWYAGMGNWKVLGGNIELSLSISLFIFMKFDSS